jgi:hypothetical protein
MDAGGTAPAVGPDPAAEDGWQRLSAAWWRVPFARGPLSEERRERLAFLESLSPLAWYARADGAMNTVVAVFEVIAIADTADSGGGHPLLTVDAWNRNERWRRVFAMPKTKAVRAGAKRLSMRHGWREILASYVFCWRRIAEQRQTG